MGLLFNRSFSRTVGYRFFKAKKSSSFLSLISGISVGGVIIGVLVMVVILSVMAGFEHELKNRLFKAEHHIRIEKVNEQRFALDEGFLEKIAQAYPAAKRIDPVLQTEAILKSGQRVSGAVLRGVSDEAWGAAKTNVVDWAPEEFLSGGEARILLGQELSYELGVVAGDIITAVSPIASTGPLGMAPKMKKFVVQGVYKSGVPEQELHVVFVERKDVESFIRREGEITQIEVTVLDLADAPTAARVLKTSLPKEYLVRSWQDLNAHLFASLRLERLAMFTMLAFIVVVAGFNILSLLTMSIIEKKQSIGILRAMGATKQQITRIFVWMGMWVALYGSFFGLSLGLAICWVLKTYPVIELPEFYYDRTLPVLIRVETIAAILCTTILIVAVGALVPARRAARLTPLASIRTAK